MKCFKLLVSVFVMALTIAVCADVSAAAPEKSKSSPSKATSPVPVQIPQSVFVMPTKPEEGRDPFFPQSTRVYETSQPKPKAVAMPVTLVLNGLSGTPDHRLAMINGRTMAEGEDAEITTSTGKCRVHCVKISTSSVLVEVNGERRELHMGGL